MVMKRNTADLERRALFKLALDKFLKEKDIPQWYRAYSTFQLKAAESLMAAIRDDVQQETTHRVRNCLSVLGLMPLLGNKNLKMIMNLSGGNDLAFLWFLMEYHYKTPNSSEYSLNEQLLLSGIAHLDMITTLRGLDNLLPTGHESKRTLSKYRALLRKKRSPLIRRRNVQNEKLMPYFEKLERPKQIKREPIIPRPEFKVSFKLYDKYKDPNYEVPNEKNRWFSMYTFRESLRVTVTETRDYFNNFFEKLEDIGERTAIKIINSALENIEKPIGEKSLCLHHRKELEYLEMKKLMWKEAERDKCLKSLELFKKEKKERLIRIHQALEKDVNMYRLKYQEKALDGKEHFQVISDNKLSEHSIRAAEGHGLGSVCTVDSTATELYSKESSQTSKNSAVAADSRRDSRSNRASVGDEAPKLSASLSALNTSASIMSITDRLYLRNYDYGHAKATSPTSSQLFFQCPTENQPYKFNYDNIFNSNQKSNTEKFIKESFVMALEDKRKDTPRQFLRMPNVGEVARKYANKNWDTSQKEFRKYYHDTRKAIGLQSIVDTKAQKNILVNDNLPPDMPRLGFYDCEDKDLMHRMLQIALDHLAKNPKYVLASLPDCHKLPVLREWIYQRYGKTYTQAERVADVERSKRMLHGLYNLETDIKLPMSREISSKQVHSYRCYHYIKEKVKRARHAYFRRTREAYLENSRLMWFAMNNALCTLSQRDMFFAYLPQRVTDVHHINPWKLHQRKDMALIWEKKHMQKKQEAVLKF